MGRYTNPASFTYYLLHYPVAVLAHPLSLLLLDPSDLARFFLVFYFLSSVSYFFYSFIYSCRS